MITYEGIDRNFGFMILEVRKQLETVHRLVQQSNGELIRTVLSRDNYIDTLKSLIERKCISYFRNNPTIDKFSANLVTAINVAATNLERIADFCVNVGLHVQRLTDPQFLMRFAYRSYFTELLEAIALVNDSLSGRDTALALRLCRAEATLNQLYERDFEQIRQSLRGGGDTDNLLTALYIFHYLERMGDSLLNIGEAVLFAATGEKLKLHDYVRLKEALQSFQPDASMGNYSIEFSWETRSGCRIAKVEERGENGSDLEAIFKKGHLDKLKQEEMNIRRWEKVLPGVPPQILQFREGEQDAALLLEFLDGFTFRDLVLNAEKRMVEQAQKELEGALDRAWQQTRVNQPVRAEFIKQTKSRLDDVFRLHPEFGSGGYRVGTLELSSLEALLARCEEVEQAIPAPFSVLIHGDLNTDNIIFNHREGSIHFIDLHRSRESDYVQDISVFLVSNFRMPVFHGGVRDTLNGVASGFHDFARDFAKRQGDTAFAVRLALGLARSFLTSTRFEVDGEFAKMMYLRAVYLLERVAEHAPGPWDRFELSTDVLLY